MTEATLTRDALVIRAEEIQHASRRGYWKAKRAFDFLVCLRLIRLSSPLRVRHSILVFIYDPSGSPIFAQTRLGLHGKPFTMYKFRTMTVGAEMCREDLLALNEMDGPVFKIRDDPRVTRVGRFLRRTSLDELPQFFNVLMGDMSLIGPRPPLPSEVEEYTEYERLRLIVKPGLTCSWQVKSDRNGMTFAEWVEEDLEYILHASFWTDVKLFLKTPLAMLRGEGC